MKIIIQKLSYDKLDSPYWRAIAEQYNLTYPTLYRRKELIPYVSDKCLKLALKKGIISKPKYGFYQLDFLKDEPIFFNNEIKEQNSQEEI